MRNASANSQKNVGSVGLAVPQEVAAGRIEDAIRRRVGRGKRYSYLSVSEQTGIPARTLESYVQGATPGTPALLTLFAFFGPSFATEVLGVVGLVAHDETDAEPEHIKVLAALGKLTAQIAEAISDGHVDHREAASLRPKAQELIDALEPLARVEDAKLRGVA